MCVDYRMLNRRSVKDAYALPRAEEVFDILHGAKVFSTIDMKNGYHQVEMEEIHKERTALQLALYNSMNIARCHLDLLTALQLTKD